MSNNNLHLEGINGLEVEWYLNGSLIDGENSQQITISQSGDYSVIVRDANGCFAASDVFKASVKQEEEEQEIEPATTTLTGNSTIQKLRVYPVHSLYQVKY